MSEESIVLAVVRTTIITAITILNWTEGLNE